MHFCLPILRRGACKQLPEKAVSGKEIGEVSLEKKLKYQIVKLVKLKVTKKTIHWKAKKKTPGRLTPKQKINTSLKEQ